MSKTNFNPLVSIIIPVYNGSNYVREAIDSALAQTYKNIEIIVVNDGSTDNTEQVVKSYGNKIKYFKKDNGGVATALNLAIKKSNGEYFSWLSHDDLYYPDKVKKQIDILSSKSEIDRKNTILMSNYALIDEQSKITAETHFEETNPIRKLEYPLYALLNGMVNGLTLLIPIKCFKEIGYFDPAKRATQDYDLWFKMFPKYKIIFMTDILAKTRMHAGQVTNKPATLLENDTLWIGMVKNMSDKQKIAVGGSIIGFYEMVYEIVKGAKFVGAEQYLLKMINQYKKRDISKIKVSVIIPFFNRINWVIEAIKSVTGQTHKNLEIILIDDGSTEDLKKIKKICNSDKRIVYYRNTKNCGVAKSRNFGIEKSTGEFIAFLDSDDLFLPNKIKKQLSFMVSNGYVFSHTSYETFEILGGNYTKMNSGKITYSYPSIISGCSIATPSVMVHKDLFRNQENIFPENINIGEDICLWIILSRECNLRGLDVVLSRVRKHGNNAADDINKQIIGIKNVFNFVLEDSLDSRSASVLEDLNRLLFQHIYSIYPYTKYNCESNILKKSQRGLNKNIFKIRNLTLHDIFLIVFYKLDKVVPKGARKNLKKKLKKYKFVRKYLIK